MSYGTTTPSSVPPAAGYSQENAGAGRDSTPAWRQYYDYAEQLYAAGHREQAEPYYLYSRQLYAAEQQASVQPQPRVEYARYSYAPQSDGVYGGHSAPMQQQTEYVSYAPVPQSDGVYGGHSAPVQQQTEYVSYAPAPQSDGVYGGQSAPVQQQTAYASYAPAPQSDGVYGGQSAPVQQQTAYASYAPSSQSNQTMSSVPATLSAPPSWSLEDEDDFGKRPKRSKKFWVVTSMIIAVAVFAGGFFGLFNLYNSRQAEKAAGFGGNSSFIAEWTVNPLMDAMSPAFDKTNRTISAAGPLLYELGFRDTFPEEFSRSAAPSPSPDNVEIAVAAVAPVPESSLSGSTDSNPATTDGEAAAPIDEAEPVEAPGEVVGDNNEEEESAVSSSSHARSDRSSGRQSSRSRSASSSAYSSSAADESLIEEIPADESPAASPMPSSPPPTDLPAPQRNSKTRELDDLLAPEPAAAPAQRSAALAEEKNTSSLRQNLSREEVQQGMSQVGPTVKRCGQGSGGTIFISVKIGTNGRIERAVATGAFAGTPVGNCAERAVQRARFPAAQNALTVKYPFGL